MFGFITTFDGNLAAGGFSPDQRRSIIGILMETKVEALAEEAPATSGT